MYCKFLQEIEEYKYLKKIQSIIGTSKITFWTLYGYTESFFNTQSWFPPFKGSKKFINNIVESNIRLIIALFCSWSSVIAYID